RPTAFATRVAIGPKTLVTGERVSAVAAAPVGLTYGRRRGASRGVGGTSSHMTPPITTALPTAATRSSGFTVQAPSAHPAADPVGSPGWNPSTTTHHRRRSPPAPARCRRTHGRALPARSSPPARSTGG